MTVRQFLKSKTFSALLILVLIALVAGGSLAVLNDVLAIDDEERVRNAIEKIYGEAVGFIERDVEEELAENEYGTVNSVYLLSDGNYLFQTTGNNGYKNGTVTLYIAVRGEEGKFAGFIKTAVAGNEKQTLMGDFKDSFFTIYASDDVLNDGYFSIDGADGTVKHVKSGATFTSRAVNNAVNACLYYIREKGGAL